MEDINYPSIYNTKLSWHKMPDETEYIIALKEQGVSNFDPIEYHKNSIANLEQQNNDDDLTKRQRKDLGKVKMSKKSKAFIDENIHRKEMILRDQENSQITIHMDKVESDDIETISSKVRSMRTNYGRVKLKAKLLNLFLSKNLNTASHLMFYSLNDEENLDDEQLNIYVNEILLNYKNKFSNENMINVQFKNLSSFLPPLDPFCKLEYSLDDWQLEVFNFIQNKKNILICAPTSAGKTVCSTYCAILGNKTIFVVPSDELARQVGGIFRNMNGVNVRIVTNKEYFPIEESDNFRVLVGTPIKIEEYLTINGHENFTYAIFDEWHMLNSNEGKSLENIFKLINCPFLALSATLESPENLRTWMQEVKGDEVNLVTYDRRFIVQQRYIYTNNTLKFLHPLSCVDMNFLNSNEFLNSNISFTARDSYDLYEKIRNITGSDELNPSLILNKNNWDRITLNDTLAYENVIKNYLHQLSNTNPELASQILNEYETNYDYDDTYDFIKLIKILIKKNMCPAIFFKVNSRECLELFKYIVNSLFESQNIKFPYHYDDLEFKQSYFFKFENDKKDNRAKATVPKDKDPEAFFQDLEKKIEDKLLDEMKNKYQLLIEKRIKNIQDSDIDDRKKEYYKRYYQKDLNEVLDFKMIHYIDKNRPHPEFCFNNQKIDSQMMRQIRRDIKNMTGESIDYNHPFLIGIERGIIPYFKDMEVPYQRIAQSLFSQKKIPIVISDESLAYGINLPIRTVVMIGDTNKEIDSVIASQMSGRSGRRGIDREGNVIYLDLNWKNVLRGRYTRLEGKNPNGYDLALPFYFKKINMKKEGEKKLSNEIQKLFKKSLYKFANNLDHVDKLEMKNSLQFIKENNLRDYKNSFIAWSLRYFGINTIYFPKLIEILNNEKDAFKIVEIIISLIDINENSIDTDSYINNIFEDIELNLYNPSYLLSVYKQNKINESNDIIRLKNISKFISILHTITSSDLVFRKTDEKIITFFDKFKNLNNFLEKIFNNLKTIIKKSLF